jgi:ABC-type uncharacterized transport system fused permease/ATPase subunit
MATAIKKSYAAVESTFIAHPHGTEGPASSIGPASSTEGPASSIGARINAQVHGLGIETKLVVLFVAVVVRGGASLWDKLIVGRMLHACASADFRTFLQLQLPALIQAAVATSANESILCVQRSIEAELRTNLSVVFTHRFFERRAFYRLGLGHADAGENEVNAIPDAASRVTDDVSIFSRTVSALASELLKPLVDIALYSWHLRMLLGANGQILVAAYLVAGIGLVRRHLPDYAALTTAERRLESSFKLAHARAKRYAESIAFCGESAAQRERHSVGRCFEQLEVLARKRSQRETLFKVLEDLVADKIPDALRYYLLLYTQARGHDTEGADPGALAADDWAITTGVDRIFKAFGVLLGFGEKLGDLWGIASRLHELLDATGRLKLEDEKLVVEDAAAKAKAGGFVDKSVHKAAAAGGGEGEGEGGEGGGEGEEEGEGKGEGAAVVFDQVDVAAPAASAARGVSASRRPQHPILIGALSLVVRQGEPLLVTGPSGCGKSALFRCVSGLWRARAGTISFIEGDCAASCASTLKGGRVVFGGIPDCGEGGHVQARSLTAVVPQQPYLVRGCLALQLTYPSAPSWVLARLEVSPLREKAKGDHSTGESSTQSLQSVRDGKALQSLMDLLESVGLGYLADRWGWFVEPDAPFEEALSLGEQQRLCMARLFYQVRQLGDGTERLSLSRPQQLAVLTS